jgi:hypothetical protein
MEVVIMATLAELRYEYRPYHTMAAFEEGYAAYEHDAYRNPYTAPSEGLAARAWNRGRECAMRWKRQS